MMGQADLVSVIVPAYNAAPTIADTLNSALAHTHDALEVIVVDDGSSDATAEVVEAFAARDSRVRLLRQANAGVAAARNLAIAHARRAYLAPLDADDLWHPEKIALQIAAMRRSGPSVGVVYCWSRQIDEAGRAGPKTWVPYPHQGDVYTALIAGNFLEYASTPLMRRACVVEAGAYDPGLRAQGAEGCEDLKLYLLLAERSEFALVPEFLVGYRVMPNNMSGDPRRMLRSYKIVLTEARRRHPELPGRLFRMGEARYEFYRRKACLRDGMPMLGLRLLLNGCRRDPGALMYRFAEPPCRMVLNWRRKRSHRAQLTAGGARPSFRWAHDILGYCAQGGAEHVLEQAAAVEGAIRFLAMATRPLPGTRICSTLYAWRCATAATRLAKPHRLQVGCEPIGDSAADGGPIRELRTWRR